jgi:hypothetical protein
MIDQVFEMVVKFCHCGAPMIPLERDNSYGACLNCDTPKGCPKTGGVCP